MRVKVPSNARIIDEEIDISMASPDSVNQG